MAKKPKPARPVTLVTGASGGIGEALAYRFAKHGYDLILVARSADRLDAVANAAKMFDAVSTAIALDLQADGAGAKLEAAVAEKGLTVDVLINNAGFGATGAVVEGDLDEQLGMVDLNCRVLTELSIRFGKGIKTRGPLSKGRAGILNVASTAAFQPGPYMAVYYASKAYVLSLSEAMNREFKGSGAHVTALCPGPVRTGFQERAAFDKSMGIANLPMQSSEQVAKTGYDGFKAKKAVVIPGAMNAVMARSAPFAPRGVLLSMVETLQKKRSGTHG
jgi:short-subunit dehydrogenase